MYSLLVKEPFNMSLADIAKLTDYQIVNILFRPEKKQGDGSEESWSPFRLFWWQLKVSQPGIFDEEIITRWQKLPPKQQNGSPIVDPAWNDDLKVN